MVDDGVLEPGGRVPEVGELLLDVVANLVEVEDVLHRDALLNLDCAPHRPLDVVVQLLVRLGNLSKIGQILFKDDFTY